MLIALVTLIALAAGAAIAWLLLRDRTAADPQLDADRIATELKAHAAEVFNSNSEQFLRLAEAKLGQHQIHAKEELEKRQRAVEQLVQPIAQQLEKVDTQLHALEKARKESQGAMSEQVRLLAEGQDKLRTETGSLVTALRAPSVRGRWGEMQLRKVVEIAGMVSHCDFIEQERVSSDDGVLIPDLVVKMPGGREVVVDAKVPLAAYIDSCECDDPDQKQAHLEAHARQVRDHITKLSGKAYWDQFPSAPDFVILFIPGESFWSAALEQAPSLIEEGANAKVHVATPTTLITMLRTIAFGWRQEKIAESAAEVSELGRELYSRLSTMGDHFAKVGSRLESTVKAYNESVGSLESRVLVTARRLADHGVVSADREIPVVTPVDTVPRELQSPELKPVAEIEPPDEEGELKVRRLAS